MSVPVEFQDNGWDVRARLVDDIEVGRGLPDTVRIAVRIDRLADASAAVADAGGAPMAEPVVTPWGDHNQRFEVAGGLQLTLFEPATRSA